MSLLDALLSAGSAVPSANAVADLAALRALTPTADQVVDVASVGDRFIAAIAGGIGVADDGVTQVKKNADGASAVIWYSLSKSSVLPTIAALRLATNSKQSSFSVQAHSVPGDGGGDTFDRDSSDTTSADDNGKTIVAGTRRYKRRCARGTFNVQHYGARGNSSTPDDAAIFAAVAAARAYGAGRVLFPMPSNGPPLAGVYTGFQYSTSYYRMVGNLGPLLIDFDGCRLEGDSRQSCIKWDATYSGEGIKISEAVANYNRRNVILSNLKVVMQNNAATAISVLRGYDLVLEHMWIQGTASASNTGYGIYLDWGTSASQDTCLATCIDKCYIQDFRTLIGNKTTLSQLTTATNITRTQFVSSLIYATQVGIDHVGSGAAITHCSFDSVYTGIVTVGGTHVALNRFEKATACDVSLLAGARDCNIGFNNYSLIAPDNVTAVPPVIYATYQEKQYNQVLDGYQATKNLNGNTEIWNSQADGQINWGNAAESTLANLFKIILTRTGFTSIFGGTAASRLMEIGGQSPIRLGTTAAYDVEVRTNSKQRLYITAGGAIAVKNTNSDPASFT
ncbi:MAG: hypothetical protein H0X39_19625, partial [Actinobacteria bacterium]|nr:hypothetical protein [Actinomycetota bacterium]